MKRITLMIVAALIATSLSAQMPEAKQVEVYGQKISYFDIGSGPVVILLHGLGANKGLWLPAIGGLSARFHIYALDQIGFGVSDKPLINYRLSTYSDFLGEFMRNLSIPKASLVGNSMGGWVAADFAIRHPEQVDRIALVDAAGYYSRSVTRAEFEFLDPSTIEGTRVMLERVFFRKEMITDAFVRRVFADRIKAGDSYTIERLLDSASRREDVLNGRLDKIKAPTIVIWGKQDPLLPVSDGDALAAQIPGAKKVIIDNCGHIPQVECTAAFEKVVVEFLGQP